jgi:hypothetical protein
VVLGAGLGGHRKFPTRREREHYLGKKSTHLIECFYKSVTEAVGTHLTLRLSRPEFLSVFVTADSHVYPELFAFRYPVGFLIDELELIASQPQEIVMIIIIIIIIITGEVYDT